MYIERVPAKVSGVNFEHLTKCEDMVISRDGHSLLCCCSLMLIDLTVDFMGQWLHFGSLSSLSFLQNLLALSSSLSS